jgi:hypothetical protein
MVGNHGLDASGSGEGPVVGSCKHEHEPSDSIKGGEFSDSDIQFNTVICGSISQYFTDNFHSEKMKVGVNWENRKLILRSKVRATNLSDINIGAILFSN